MSIEVRIRETSASYLTPEDLQLIDRVYRRVNELQPDSSETRNLASEIFALFQIGVVGEADLVNRLLERYGQRA